MDTKLDNVKVLVVGAGGIGCELLKNLVLTGFNDIEVIDLDTIELSNLNRQFLFQKCHVGKPKAIIARESVLKYNPNAKIFAFHDSIMNVKYNVDYFKQFNIVLNALDNKAARSHVNRLCLAADVPLIESGSAGYLGQVTLIKKSLTECYDCLPKPPAKTFPGCTIRNTPSEPIHCIVWAKHLFNQLFGAEDPDEAVSPDGEDPENMAEAGKAAVEKSSEQEAVVRISTRQWAKETNYDSEKLFNKLFSDDIKYLLSMSKLWEKRKAPTPLDWNTVSTAPEISESSETNKTSQEENKIASLKIWSINECCKVFSESVNLLHKRLKESTDENPILYWDKDDEDALNFVAASANLRCLIFSIQVKSKFEIKSLAGNIIPAIATTNAIVAGLIVLNALKVLNNNINDCKTVFLRDKPSQNKLIVSSRLEKPNEKCYVCASKPEITVKLNTNTFTVKQLETKILKQELNMVQPDVEIDDGTGRIIISSEEGETEGNNDKTLSFFGLTNQSSLKCDDFFQNYELKITLLQCDQFESDNQKEYEIIADNQMLKNIQEQAQKENQQKEEEKKKNIDSNDDIIFENNDTSMHVENGTSEDKKRSYEAAFEEEDPSSVSSNPPQIQVKKLKSSNNSSGKATIAEADEVLCTSNSINDASDAISDNDDGTVQSKNKNDSVTPKNTCDEVIEVDDDIIIEDSNEQESNSNDQCTTNHTDQQSNGHYTEVNLQRNNISSSSKKQKQNVDDDDVIECSSDEDIIEINDDDEDSSNYKNDSNQSNGVSSTTTCVNKKILKSSINSININNNIAEINENNSIAMISEISNGNCTNTEAFFVSTTKLITSNSNGNSNGSKQHIEESDDTITVE